MSKYVVIDLEMCEISKGLRTKEYPYKHEVIQIGAVLLDENFDITDQFSTFVKPSFGWISPKIERLTGISAAQLIDAPDFSVALSFFADWIPEGDVKIVEWSDSDEKQLRKEMEYKNVICEKISKILDSYIDCQLLFSEKVSEKRQFNLTDALIIADIYPEGKEHDGLADAYNTALLYAKINQDEEFRINTIYKDSKNEEVSHLEFSLGSLFTGMVFA